MCRFILIGINGQGLMGITAYLLDHDPIFIASWKGFQKFHDALESLGQEKFPTILAQLPEGDEGETSAENAAIMLQELDHFEHEQGQLQQLILMDSERDIELSTGGIIAHGTISTDHLRGYDLGFDESGFFVRDRWELNRILFHAMRVEQKLVDAAERIVEYIDLDHGHSFRCNVPFGIIETDDGGDPQVVVRKFHVEERPIPSHHFAYIISPLKRALQMSVDSGQVIAWG